MSVIGQYLPFLPKEVIAQLDAEIMEADEAGDSGGPPAASETVAGIAELATQVETDAGTDDARMVTPLKLATAAVNAGVEVALTDEATIAYDVAAGVNASVVLDDDRILNWTNPVAGQRGTIRLIQDDTTGSRLITAYQLAGSAAAVSWAAGAAPTLTVAVDSVDALEWYFDGTTLHLKIFGLDMSAV